MSQTSDRKDFSNFTFRCIVRFIRAYLLSASNTVTVNGAKVVQADIPATNGIVGVVDKVIVPSNFK